MRIERENTVALVIDYQEKLVPVMDEITEERFKEINQKYKYVEKIVENKKENKKKADK